MAHKLFPIDWDNIDTVLLDMDGTILDLSFDNYFWLELVPQEYALEHQLTLQIASGKLSLLYQQHKGTLNWYCTDFWTQQLGIDVVSLKREISQKIAYRDGALQCLEQLKQMNKKCYLITNAHPDTLSIKINQEDFSGYFEKMITSHEIGYAKEQNEFWNSLQNKIKFNPRKTLFVDDSVSVLNAASYYGIKYTIGVSQPDSTKEPVEFDDYASINNLTELLSVTKVVA